MKNKNFIFFTLIIVLITNLLIFKHHSNSNNVLKIFNWGQFIDPECLKIFEEEYNVKIIYDTYDSNEIMYRKIKSGKAKYDIVFPSDYMAEKMIKEDLLDVIDKNYLSNITNIDQKLLYKPFDPLQKYTVPYFWGTVGIIYNKNSVINPQKSWNLLWNSEYKNKILMYSSIRDTLMIGLKKLGYSMNTKNLNEIDMATNSLIEQKRNNLGYVGDEVINAMINDQADIAVIYSGDATTIMKENKNMEYFIPEEGSNIWIDNISIVKNTEKRDLAHKFIDFLCRTDISKLNTEFVGYSTPNKEILNQILNEEPEEINWLSYNPNLSDLNNMEFFSLPDTIIYEKYNDSWEKILNST